MYTECPSCKTLFRISQDQLASVGGKVRCGFCYGMFNAYDYLFEEPKAESDEPNEQAYRPEIDEKDLGEEGQTATAVSHQTQVRNAVATAPPSVRARAAPPPAQRPPRVTAAPATSAPRTSPGAQPPNLFDAIDLAGRELQQVTRTQLITRRRSTPVMSRGDTLLTAGWATATFVLLILIAGQFTYYKREDLSRYVALRPFMESFCRTIGCSIPLMKSPQQIRLVSRDIRNPPSAENALQVRATILNEARFSQPYPLLRLDLTDVSGNIIASRQFHPEEYLPQTTDINTGMDAKQKVEVLLNILDTQQAAVGFEFSFQ
jgi:predicted Zn finger-like uncharacterized protein